MINAKLLVKESTYKCAVEKIWNAITDKEQMKEWYFEVSDFKAEIGFEFQFYGESEGRKYLHKCTIVEMEPFKKIAYTWSYEGYTGKSLLKFELFNEGDNTTRLKLTHLGLDTFPKDNPDFAEENFHLGWKILLEESLRSFVETKDSI